MKMAYGSYGVNESSAASKASNGIGERHLAMASIIGGISWHQLVASYQQQPAQRYQHQYGVKKKKTMA
jgi:hypothetical protein